MILIVWASFGQMSLMSFNQDFYAPGVAAPMEGDRSVEYVRVYGYVFRFNETSEQDDPVKNLRVRIWATDELFEDIVQTDDNGRYESVAVFRVGQLVTLLIEEVRYIRFISYHAEDVCELDSIYL